ncbi:MAG: hypothetical protein WCF67_07585 [Chitinophagaceae bacterium]
MKRFLIALTLISAVGFFSFRTINNKYADILTALGIPPAMAKDRIGGSFIGSFFAQPSTNTYKKYPTGKRAEAVQQLGLFTKNYLLSVEFQKRYQEEIELMKPTAPKTMEERMQEQLADFRKMIKDNEESYKKVADNMKPIIESNIKGLKDYIAIYEDKNHPKHARQMQSLKMQADGDLKWYQDQVAKLEQKYPKDIKQFLKMRLQEFLNMSADVDFDAELVQDGKLKRFVKREYESKSMNWKYCFRAGKETVDAARQFAQQWLKELN